MGRSSNMSNEEDRSFPWKDIDSCRSYKRFIESESSESDLRARLQGSIDPCSGCGKSFKDMEVLYFKSPPSTWEHLCGQAGWMVICPDCKNQIWFECDLMN